MFGSANLSNPLNAGQGKQTGGFGSGSSGGFAFGGTGGASTTTGGFGFGTGTTGGLGGGSLGGFGATASTNPQGGFANNNMQMNPSGVLPGAAMQSQADYRMQYFDLGLMKYQEIKNASGKHDHLKRFFYEEINKFQYVVEQQDTLCRDISRTYIKAHRSLLTKLDQEVYRMEQDVNEVKNMLGKHRKCNRQQFVFLFFLFLDSRFRPFTNTCFTHRQANARYEFDDAQNPERIKDRWNSSWKVEAKRKPTPDCVF